MRLPNHDPFDGRGPVARRRTSGDPAVQLSERPSHARLQQRMFAPAAGFIALILLAVPTPSEACGWWGDAEGDASGEAVAVDRNGEVVPGNAAAAETPEALTKQANRLRQFGASGYAGALRLYRRAAAAGFAPAQNNLAAMLEEGLGVAPDLEQAAHWYRLAAEQGEPHAQHSLGGMLIAGRGVARDVGAGLRRIEAAARQGHASACADLGRFYASGEHLEKSVNKAIYWWQQAESNGYPEASKALKMLRQGRQQ